MAQNDTPARPDDRRGPPRGAGDRPDRPPRRDGPPGAPGAEDAATATAEPAAPVTVNADGSITIAESGEVVGPPPTTWVGIGLKPDARYGNLLVAKFVNCLMYDGKKVTAENLFYDAMEQIANKLKQDPLPVFEQAIQNAKPLVEVRSKRIGGANYQVPVEVNKRRQQTLAIRWILEAVRTRKGRPTAEKLAQELVDCYNKTGTTIQKRENTHRMAEANKAFSHFA
jgi:small subunit ribosomal protein S7